MTDRKFPREKPTGIDKAGAQVVASETVPPDATGALQITPGAFKRLLDGFTITKGKEIVFLDPDEKQVLLQCAAKALSQSGTVKSAVEAFQEAKSSGRLPAQMDDSWFEQPLSRDWARGDVKVTGGTEVVESSARVIESPAVEAAAPQKVAHDAPPPSEAASDLDVLRAKVQPEGADAPLALAPPPPPVPPQPSERPSRRKRQRQREGGGAAGIEKKPESSPGPISLSAAATGASGGSEGSNGSSGSPERGGNQKEAEYIAKAEAENPPKVFTDLRRVVRDGQREWPEDRIRLLKIAIGKQGALYARLWNPSRLKLSSQERAILKSARTDLRRELERQAAEQARITAREARIVSGRAKLTAEEIEALQSAVTRGELGDVQARDFFAMISGWFGGGVVSKRMGVAWGEENQRILNQVRPFLLPVWKQQKVERKSRLVQQQREVSQWADDAFDEFGLKAAIGAKSIIRRVRRKRTAQRSKHGRPGVAVEGVRAARSMTSLRERTVPLSEQEKSRLQVEAALLTGTDKITETELQAYYGVWERDAGRGVAQNPAEEDLLRKLNPILARLMQVSSKK